MWRVEDKKDVGQSSASHTDIRSPASLPAAAHSSPLPFRGSVHFCWANSPLASLAFAFAFAFACNLILLILELFGSYDGNFPKNNKRMAQLSAIRKALLLLRLLKEAISII